jgi:hypothetical protein
MGALKESTAMSKDDMYQFIKISNDRVRNMLALDVVGSNP